MAGNVEEQGELARGWMEGPRVWGVVELMKLGLGIARQEGDPCLVGNQG